MTRERGPTTNQVPSNELNHVRRYMITLRPRPRFTNDGFGTARPKIQWLGRPQGMTSGWLTDTYHNRELAVEIRSRHRANPPWRGPLRAWRSVHRSDRGPEVLFRLQARVTLTLCDFFCGPSAFGPSLLSLGLPIFCAISRKTEGCQMSTT
jgi:hypothetical protein